MSMAQHAVEAMRHKHVAVVDSGFGRGWAQDVGGVHTHSRGGGGML